jgi:DNA-binding GntR family transcriptional regulator
VHDAESLTLANEVYGVVRRRILRGDLAVGEVISRRRIAADLSTSLPPVTEALVRLECEGLLEHRPRAGTRVRVPSPEDLRGQAIVREALEVEAAVRFTQFATPRERAELQRLAAKVDELEHHADRHAFAALHHKLHLRIAECSRCPALSDAIEKTCALTSLWLLSLPRYGHDESGDPASGGHRTLVDAVTSGDPATAAAAVRQHIAYGLERSLESLNAFFTTDGRGELRLRATLSLRRTVFRRAPRAAPAVLVR